MDRFAILWPCSKITTPEVFRKSSAPLLGPFATLKVLKTVIIINFNLQRAVIIKSISATPNFHSVSKNVIQLCPLFVFKNNVYLSFSFLVICLFIATT